jgi:Flp pilus assembly protein TadG
LIQRRSGERWPRAASRRDGYQRGQAVLYVIVIFPVILLCLVAAVGLGALQLEKQRMRSALDEATAVAVARGGEQPAGRLTLDPTTTAALVRQSIADNLGPLADQLDGVGPAQVAADADVAVVVDVPATDPFDAGAVIRRPTLEVRMRAPVHASLLGFAGLPQAVTLTLTSSADLRVGGGGA